MPNAISPPTEAAQIQASHSNLVSCMKLSRKHAFYAGLLAFSSLMFLLLGLFGPGLVQQALNRGIMGAILWFPDSPEPVDVRYRGVCDPSDHRALFAHVTLHLYNITNIDDMRTSGAKPALALVGPYRFLKLTCKLDVWWDARGRVSAKDYIRFLPYPGGPLPGDADPNATITTINMALAGVVEAVHASMGPEGARWLDLLVTVLAGWRDEHVNGMFVRRTAQELLWGYEDPLLTRLQLLLPPGTIPQTRVQLLQNATSPAEALARPPSMYDTGMFDTNNIWTVLRDKNVTEVTGWPGGDECAEEVRGTDGTQFRPGLHCTRDRLQVWMSQLFRSTEMKCTGAKFFHGIKLLRYLPDPSWSAPNECKQQHIPGLLNITAPMAVGAAGNGTAAAGPPVYVSRPHFCGCDPSLRAGVTGLPGCENMDENLNVWVDVEPLTGISMRATQSIMVSSEVTAAAREHLEPRMNTSPIVPIMWDHETIEAPQEQAEEFVYKVYGARRLKAHLHLWPLLIAVVCASACSCVLVHASFSNLRLIQQAQEEQRQRERQVRQDIINRSIQAAEASRANSSPGLVTAAGEGATPDDENGLKQPLLPPASEVRERLIAQNKALVEANPVAFSEEQALQAEAGQRQRQ